MPHHVGDIDAPMIPMLPTVGSLTVSEIMDLWIRGRSGVHPPLKDLMSSKQRGRVLYGSRKGGKNSQNHGRAIRIVATSMELLKERVSCQEVDGALQEIGKNTSKFSKELAAMFTELGLTSKNTLMTTGTSLESTLESLIGTVIMQIPSRIIPVLMWKRYSRNLKPC